MTKAFPIIKTNRLLLRQFIDSDLQNVFNGLSNPDIIRYYGVSFRTLEETKLQMQFFRDLEDQETGIWWAICSPDNTIFYGAAGLNNVHKEHKRAEIGFWLNPVFWRQGIMTEAITEVCNYGFNALGLHRIEAIVESENVGSKSILSKMAFAYEGTMKECEIKRGKFISLQIYARLS